MSTLLITAVDLGLLALIGSERGWPEPVVAGSLALAGLVIAIAVWKAWDMTLHPTNAPRRR